MCVCAKKQNFSILLAYMCFYVYLSRSSSVSISQLEIYPRTTQYFINLYYLIGSWSKFKIQIHAFIHKKDGQERTTVSSVQQKSTSDALLLLLLLLATQDFLNIFIPYHSSSSACPNTSEIWTHLAL